MSSHPVIVSVLLFALFTVVFVFFLVPKIIVLTIKDFTRERKVTYGGFFRGQKLIVYYEKDEPNKFWFSILLKSVLIFFAVFWFIQSIFAFLKLLGDS